MSRRRVQVDRKTDLWTMPDAEVSLLRRPLVELLARLGPDYLHRTQLRFLQTGTELRAKSRGGVEFRYRLAGLLRRGKWPAKEIRYPVYASLPLYRLLNSLPDQEIGLTWPQPGTTALHSSAATFQIPTTWDTAREDPEPVTPGSETACYTADWLSLCRHVCPFAGRDVTADAAKYWQCQLSLQVSPQGGLLSMVATDARTLAHGALDAFHVHGTATAASRFLAADLRWAGRLLAAIQPECLQLAFHADSLVLTAADLWLRIPQPPTFPRFPDTQAVCRPTEGYKAVWRTTTQDLLPVLRAAVSFQTAAELRPVELSLDAGRVTLRAKAAGWTSLVRAAGEYDGPPLQGWFDARRLLQCLQVAEPQPLRLCFGPSVLDDPMRLELTAAHAFYLIMPMATDNPEGELPGDREPEPVATTVEADP